MVGTGDGWGGGSGVLYKDAHELNENFNRDRKHKNGVENIKKNQSGMKNTITEMEIKLEGINRRLHEEQDQISDLEDKASENTHSEQETKRKKMRIELC